PDMLPTGEQVLIEEFGIETVVKDYIAGMTDRFAINTYENIFEK
ncbi:MAG: deoxyguanosinetriphosphate triphosphohydrolase, partial [[Eubacterium] sulci]|nr:deoxyguanosinetriphosphate triphosphohydrolase [[Eubacterium] sulci]